MNKKPFIVLFIIFTAFMIFSCGTKAEAEKTTEENKGPTKEELYKEMETAFLANKYITAKSIFTTLNTTYPNTKETEDGWKMFDEIEKIEKEQEEERKKEIEKLAVYFKRLKKDVDDIEDKTWYENPYFVHYNNRNYVSLYMGQNKEKPPFLRLKMSYYGEDWIFFEKIYLSYEGNTVTVDFDKYKDKETESDTKVWEWVDVRVEPSLLSFLRDFSKSKDAKIRFSGKYTETRTLTENERKGLIDVINGYDYLSSR